MSTTANENIRQSVRENYGYIARTERAPLGNTTTPSCCGDSPAPDPSAKACGCGGGHVRAEQMSALIGYSQEEQEGVPEGANLGLGCGNPQTIAALQPGETVVDLGPGGGFDCFLAARQVGSDGRVIGVDMTPDMISRARLNAAKIQADNVKFRLGEIEHLPVADEQADLIMSNCVINLSPEKQKVYHEAFRVLKSNGRLAISDIVALRPLPDEIKSDLEMVSACIGGAATVADIENMLKRAGFEHIRVTPTRVSQEIVDEWLPGSNVGEYVAPASIEARKPAATFT